MHPSAEILDALKNLFFLLRRYLLGLLDKKVEVGNILRATKPIPPLAGKMGLVFMNIQLKCDVGLGCSNELILLSGQQKLTLNYR